MVEERRLTVLGRYRYEAIPTVTHFVGEAAQAAGLDEEEVFHCQMAADEACTNIIEHAYGEGVGDIEITCLVEDGKCTIHIVDYGKPFDPDSVPPPKLTENLDDIKPGGIGLYLMRKVMDEVVFDFTGPGNRLTLVKTHTAEVGPPVPGAVPVHEAAGGVWVVAPQGRLDAAHAPQLEETLTGLLNRGCDRLIVDMEGVQYISSRGLKVLLSAWRAAGDAGGDLVLCSLVPRVLVIFEMVGFTQVFDFYGTLNEALAAVVAQRD
jgi:anti-anti-sigma factor